ncbi:TPA: hypothetical protein ACSTLU_004347 [Serratia fonticola]
MTAITTSGGITIVAPQKSTGLRSDVQYLEPYASSSFNRKAYGIFGAGVYQGFSVTPGNGLAVIVSPNGTRPGVASVDVSGHQITVQLLTAQTVAVTAGKLNIVVLEAKYGLGVVTDQVDANSKIKAATLRVVNDEKSIVDGMIEICRLNLAANATSVPAASIDIDKRFSLRVSYESTDDINDARENRLLTVKAGKSFVPLAGGTMTGALGTPRVVFPNDSKANASTDMDRADGFTVENLTAANKGYPVPGGLGTLMSAKVNEVRNVQLAFGSGNTAFYLRSLRKDDPTSDKWDRVYTQAFKPTAADVGALTDAQAAQKYALRSIKVNGKPLSADVNLVAGDVNAYTKTEADGLYAAKARNLADLANKAEARNNLALGSSATRNAGKDTGNVMINGDFGVGGATPILSSTNTLTIIKSLKTGKYAVNGDSTDMPSAALAYELDWSFTSTSSGGHGSLLAKPLINRGHANDRVYRNTLRGGVWQGWVGLYDTENKPTAADVGALTDAQAAQKYALRSILVNGKPLSANVNLLAGDVNAWNKTEADGRYLAKASNLADLPDKAKSRTSLGLGTSATQNVGEATGQVLTADKAFGLGLMQPDRRHLLSDIAGANAFTGFTWSKSDEPNAPPFTGTAGIINHAWRPSATTAPYIMQLAWRDGRIAFRTKESTKDFRDWYEFLHTGNSYTAEKADSLYLAKNSNLADLDDKGKSRESLGLKSAALRDVGTDRGQLMEVGSFGLGGGGTLLNAATDGEFMTAANALGSGFFRNSSPTGTNIPRYGAGFFSRTADTNTLIVSDYNSGRTVVLASNNTNIATPKVNVLYGTANKPTAADVGALTDAQAAQKYALRSILVNGKPLSANVNLLAGDVNAWNKTESDGRFLMLSGGTVKNLTVKTGSTGTENTALLIDGVEHTPLVLKRASATANISIGFQLGGGKPLYRLGMDINNNLAWGTEANQTNNGIIYHTKNKPNAVDVGAVAITGSTMTGPLGTPSIVFPMDNRAMAADDASRADGFTVQQLTATNKGYPVSLGVLMTAKLNEFRNVQLAFGSGSTQFFLRSLRKGEAATEPWDRVYTQAFKPTAADVGALTDAQAAQKYALRSIKVNGKPLSADVNLVAGDVNAYTKTEADGRYLMLSGGLVKGRAGFAGGLHLGNVNTLIEAGSDAAGYTSNNLMLKSWYGIGFANTCTTTGIQGVSGFINVRNGDLQMRRFITADAQIIEAGKRVYSPNNKPTAADVGALTDAQAAQKYALRSILVNGKPLSANVNLVAGDVNAWNKTEADARFLLKTGGTLTGILKTSSEIQSTNANNYRIVAGDYGSFWRQDATALYLLLTAPKDQYGSYNSLRPMAVSVTTGAMTLGTSLTFSNNDWIRKLGINNYTSAGQNYNQTNGMILQGAGDQYAQTYFLETIGKHSALRWRVRSGGIDAWPEFRNDGTLQLSGKWPAIQNNVGTTWHPDGNIQGSCWGGYLSNYIRGRSNVAGTRQAWWYKDENTGFIHQGGVINRGDNYLNPVNFPRGYTQDCFSVQLTLAGHWGDSNMNMEAQSVSAGGFNAALGDNERVIFWSAVGV